MYFLGDDDGSRGSDCFLVVRFVDDERLYCDAEADVLTMVNRTKGMYFSLSLSLSISVTFIQFTFLKIIDLREKPIK